MANVDALDVAQLQIEKRNLHVPTLGELRQVLAEGLSENFTESSVEIVDCPDLTKNPFTLAAPGLGGKATILEVGGPPFLLPTVQRNKLYNIRTLLNHLKYGEESFIVGAGAGPWPHLNSNCEMMMNLHLSPNQIKNNTHLASVNQQNGKCVLHDLPNDELRFALLANLYVSEGKPGKVLKVYAKKRTGNNDFIASMQKSIAKHYKDQLVGLGGTFIMNEGKIKQHVMPDFSPVPLNSLKELDGWLKFYDMSTPLIAVGTFVSAETDLDLRVQHFHSFSQHGEGGHYHIDTTPESIEYLGYFNVGDVLYRIDKPPHTLQFGKD